MSQSLPAECIFWLLYFIVHDYPPRPRLCSHPGPMIDLPDFSLPESLPEENEGITIKRSLMHRSCSKRDLDTVSADEIIPQRSYPASCPAPLHYKIPTKKEEQIIGSLTVMSLLEDCIDVTENISQEATPHPDEEESESETESEDGGDVFDVGD